MRRCGIDPNRPAGKATVWRGDDQLRWYQRAVDAVRTLRVERWIESSYGCVIAMTEGGATNMVSRVVNDVPVDECRSERRGMDVLSRQHR